MMFLVTETVIAGAESLRWKDFLNLNQLLFFFASLSDQTSSKTAKNPVGWRDVQAGANAEKKVGVH